jgi:hypothetical protein
MYIYTAHTNELFYMSVSATISSDAFTAAALAADLFDDCQLVLFMMLH